VPTPLMDVGVCGDVRVTYRTPRGCCWAVPRGAAIARPGPGGPFVDWYATAQAMASGPVARTASGRSPCKRHPPPAADTKALLRDRLRDLGAA